MTVRTTELRRRPTSRLCAAMANSFGVGVGLAPTLGARGQHAIGAVPEISERPLGLARNATWTSGRVGTVGADRPTSCVEAFSSLPSSSRCRSKGQAPAGLVDPLADNAGWATGSSETTRGRRPYTPHEARTDPGEPADRHPRPACSTQPRTSSQLRLCLLPIHHTAVLLTFPLLCRPARHNT
jgi:hypothetical protein